MESAIFSRLTGGWTRGCRGLHGLWTLNEVLMISSVLKIHIVEHSVIWKKKVPSERWDEIYGQCVWAEYYLRQDDKRVNCRHNSYAPLQHDLFIRRGIPKQPTARIQVKQGSTSNYLVGFKSKFIHVFFPTNLNLKSKAQAQVQTDN